MLLYIIHICTSDLFLVLHQVIIILSSHVHHYYSTIHHTNCRLYHCSIWYSTQHCLSCAMFIYYVHGFYWTYIVYAYDILLYVPLQILSLIVLVQINHCHCHCHLNWQLAIMTSFFKRQHEKKMTPSVLIDSLEYNVLDKRRWAFFLSSSFLQEVVQ
jgi:hypothetical protein